MNTSETPTEAELEKVDAEAVLAQLIKGKPLDPEVARRVRARAERVTEEIRREHGDIDVVQLLHDAREDA